MSTVTVNVIEEATEAAKEAGAICPEGVAAFLEDDLTIVDTMSGPQVMVRNGLEIESLAGAIARMRVTEGVASLFHGGPVNVEDLDHDLYRVIRKHKPELIGLRSKRS